MKKFNKISLAEAHKYLSDFFPNEKLEKSLLPDSSGINKLLESVGHVRIWDEILGFGDGYGLSDKELMEILFKGLDLFGDLLIYNDEIWIENKELIVIDFQDLKEFVTKEFYKHYSGHFFGPFDVSFIFLQQKILVGQHHDGYLIQYKVK